MATGSLFILPLPGLLAWWSVEARMPYREKAVAPLLLAADCRFSYGTGRALLRRARWPATQAEGTRGESPTGTAARAVSLNPSKRIGRRSKTELPSPVSRSRSALGRFAITPRRARPS